MCKPPVVVVNLTLQCDGEVDIKLQVKGGKMVLQGRNIKLTGVVYFLGNLLYSEYFF